MRKITVFVLPLLIAGLAAHAALAAQADLDVIKEQCAKQLNMPGEGCECVVRKASELNDNQQAFAAAILNDDDKKREQTEKEMLPDDIREVGQFMNSARTECASG